MFRTCSSNQKKPGEQPPTPWHRPVAMQRTRPVVWYRVVYPVVMGCRPWWGTRGGGPGTGPVSRGSHFASEMSHFASEKPPGVRNKTVKSGQNTVLSINTVNKHRLS